MEIVRGIGLRAGQLWSTSILSVRSTIVGRILLAVLSFLRCGLLYEPYTNLYHSDMPINTCVVMIGVIIAEECFCSIMSYVYRLQFRTLMRQYIISFQSLLVFLFSACSIANTVWLFMQVRNHWIQHLPVVVQVLHSVPSSLLVIQALLQGTYLYCLSSLDVRPRGDMTELMKHLRSQIYLNLTLLVYSLTTEVAIAVRSDSVFAAASIVYLTGETVYRLYSVYRLWKLKARCEGDDRERKAETETVPFYFQSGVTEERYDDTRETVVIGSLRRRVRRGI